MCIRIRPLVVQKIKESHQWHAGFYVNVGLRFSKDLLQVYKQKIRSFFLTNFKNQVGSRSDSYELAKPESTNLQSDPDPQHWAE